MKKIMSLFLVVVIFVIFSVSVFATDYSIGLDFVSVATYRLIFLDRNTDELFLLQSNKIMSKGIVADGIAVYSTVHGSKLWKDIYSATDVNNENYGCWHRIQTNQTVYHTSPTVNPFPLVQSAGFDDGYIIWSNYDVPFVSDHNTIVFFEADSVDLSNYEIGGDTGGDTVFDDTGIINSINGLRNSINSMKNDIVGGLNNLNQKLSDVNSKLALIQMALYQTVDDVQYSVAQLLQSIKENTFSMVGMLQTLPADIASELDTLLNPDSDNLPGSFGETASAAIEDKFSIVNDMKTVFNSVESQNSPIVIENNVKVGTFTFPVKIDFSWYEPYRLHIRSGLGGLFWVMCLIACWSTLSGIFGIGVKTGVSGYMADQLPAGVKEFSQSKGYSNKGADD